jgi:hypothetical protein
MILPDKRRARRRRDKQRMKARAKRVYFFFSNDPSEAAKLADHLAHCSLSCCGNPRRWFGQLTMQERRAFQCDEIEYAGIAQE